MGQTSRMLALYRETAVLAWKRALKAWPVAFSVVLFGAIELIAARLVAGTGVVGSIVMMLVGAACASGYLYLLSQAVQGSRIGLTDLKRSFGVLFWDVISVRFALWILGFLITPLVAGAGENGLAVAAMIGLAMAFFLNPVPEMIYQGNTRSFALLLESARFVLANPIAWFLPNVLFAVLLLAPTGGLSVGQPGELLLVFSQVFSQEGLIDVAVRLPLWALPLFLAFLHYVMVFRGLLFQNLRTGSARQRAWQAQMRS
jgi:hypothetical protein